MKRAVRRTIRLSEEESERYEQAAHAEGVEFSEWVRRACETRPPSIQVPPGLREQVDETLTITQALNGYSNTANLHAPGCPCRACNPTPTVAKVARIDREKRS